MLRRTIARLPEILRARLETYSAPAAQRPELPKNLSLDELKAELRKRVARHIVACDRLHPLVPEYLERYTEIVGDLRELVSGTEMKIEPQLWNSTLEVGSKKWPAEALLFSAFEQKFGIRASVVETDKVLHLGILLHTNWLLRPVVWRGGQRWEGKEDRAPLAREDFQRLLVDAF